MPIMTEFQLVLTFQCKHCAHLQDQITHRHKHRERIFISTLRAQEELVCAKRLTGQGRCFTHCLSVFTTSEARISLGNGHLVWKWQNKFHSALSSSKPVIFPLRLVSCVSTNSKADLNTPLASLLKIYFFPQNNSSFTM